MKLSNDPIEILKSVTRQSCNAMHMISSLMTQVRDIRKNHCFNERSCPNGELTSVNAPDCLDRIMDELVYMMECEANCGVGNVSYDNSKVVAEICVFDENGTPKS